uniref:TRUD domain-containing protein n=1 Tax=Tetradesmus obliquus TaxID=3088 RepID=A0A383W6L3_TETOB|eukprot:jgi/Sobl393_1/8814/SZX73288.1
MQEQQVGIEEYTTSTTGFTGILKHRYNDFQVFEVDLTGRTAHLSATDAAPQAQQQATASSSSAVITDTAIAEVVAAFAAIAGQANAEQLQKLLTNIQQQQQQAAAAEASAQQQQQQQQGAAAPDLEVDLLPEGNKDVRKAIHQFLKSEPRLPPLATESVAAEGASAGPDGQVPHHVIRIRPGSSGGRGQRGSQDKRGQKRGKREWRDEMSWEGGDLKHVKFVMLKENTDTQAALGVVARMLHCQPRSFGFAGTKDKRGVTTQWVTAFKVSPAKLAALNPRLRGIKLGNFEFAASHLSLGQLGGNRFKLLMRDVSSSDEQHIAATVSELRSKGFLNYFGLQRFGIGAVPTHRVGAALLRGEWQGAVRLVMQGGPGERREYRQARALYMEQGDIQGALKVLPTSLVAERAVLQGLARHGSTAYLTALQGIPRTLRSMYMHAWQSWLWNRAASERFRRYGAEQAVAGDLVLLTTEQQQQDADAEAAAAAAAGGSAAAAVDALYDAEDTGTADAADEGDDVSAAASAAARLASVHVVTAAEAAAGRFSIRDVVLPLPGGRVQYPQHEAGWQLYCRMAAADGVMLPGMTAAEFADAAAAAAAAAAEAAAVGPQDGAGGTEAAARAAGAPASHGVKDFQLAGLSGDYRRLLHVPEDMQHQVIRYSNPDAELLQSDWSQLQQQQQQQLGGDRQHKRQRLDEQQQQQQQQQQRSSRQMQL